MTDEQGETLYRLKMSIDTPLNGGSTIIVDKEDIETVLNILKQNSAEIAEKSAEIEKYKDLYNKALEDLAKTNRKNIENKMQIDLMAERIEWLCKSNGILLDKEHDENFIQQDIKQYFERKAREWLK